MFVWITGDIIKGVAEASDMGNRHLQRVFDDACDLGFLVEGRRATLIFVMTTIVQDGEGEITGWEYVAVGHPHITITVYND
jgi:hypothetical protein